MKRITTAIVFIAAMFMSLAAQDSKQLLISTIEEVNKTCPITLGSMGNITKMEYAEPNVRITALLEGSFVNIPLLREKPDLLKKNLLAILGMNTGETNVFMDLILDAKAGVEMRYTDTSSDELTIMLSYDDLRNGLEESSLETPIMVLERMLQVNNLSCPLDIGNGLKLISASIEGDYVLYNVSNDESLMSVQTIAANEQLMHDISLESLKNDVASTQLLYLCKKAGKGIAYNYHGLKSGKSHIIYIQPSEL